MQMIINAFMWRDKTLSSIVKFSESNTIKE